MLPTQAHIVRNKRQRLLGLCLVGIGAAFGTWLLLHRGGQGSGLGTQTGQSAAIANWKTYTDTQHGFSLHYPPTWQRLTGRVKPGKPEPPGFQVNVFALHDCTSAAEYARMEIIPVYPHLTLSPLPNRQVDGFVVAGLHLDNTTPGPEAVILNCPYAIHIGLNPTGMPDADHLVTQVLSSIHVWKPALLSK